MLALTLVAMLVGVLVSLSIHLVGDKPVTPEDVFWKAVQRGRAEALKHEKDLRLAYDGKENDLVLTGGEQPMKFPLPAMKDLTVDFLAPLSAGRSAVLIGGQVVESSPIPYVTFYADGTCSPFRTQFRNGGAVRVVEIDPWTCAKVLPKLDSNP